MRGVLPESERTANPVQSSCSAVRRSFGKPVGSRPHHYNSGADPFAVQKLAGHPDVRMTTQTNAHVQAEALGRVAGA